jgi:transposase
MPGGVAAGVADGAGVAPPTIRSSCAPHREQNRESGGLRWPQTGQAVVALTFGVSHARGEGRYGTLRKATTAFWPPKPKELLIANVRSASRGSFGT